MTRMSASGAGERSRNRKIKMDKIKIGESIYPDDWDTMAYPTVEDAIREHVAWERASASLDERFYERCEIIRIISRAIGNQQNTGCIKTLKSVREEIIERFEFEKNKIKGGDGE